MAKADSGIPTDPTVETATVGVSEVFTAATLGSARFLGREDIGRLAPGAKADLVLVDLDHPLMQPLWDPLRSLIYSAAERAVRDVYVDGRQVVRDQRMLSFDMEDAGKRLQASQARIAEAVMGRDEAGRTAEQLSPLALAQVRGLAPD